MGKATIKPQDEGLFGDLFEPSSTATKTPLEGRKPDTAAAVSDTPLPKDEPTASIATPRSLVPDEGARIVKADRHADGKVVLADGVEYRTLYLWSRAYDALIKNSAICQEFNTTHRGDLLILREDGMHGSGRGNYVLLAELIDIRDECVGQVRRYIWTFRNLRETVQRSGRRELLIGRVTFHPPVPPPAGGPL